ncbi:hypothetical protein [Amycolatopsis sp. NBC_00438]|uniref:hypothetical protein n=1 Tax=Amycolatopsis sp. NBC_00438 TaxID=2903558 RepID=UPI002E1D91CD
MKVLKIPDWTEFFCDSVRDVHGNEFPLVYETALHVDIQPRLHAWSVPRKREVHVSALTRELLLRVNVLLVNATGYFDPENPALNRDVGAQGAKYILGYLLAGYDDLNYSRLPVARAQSHEHFHEAMLITQTQVEFMISHEFGHVAQDLAGLNLADRETRCDDFAFDVISKTERVQRVFIALRWLFLIISLERLLGEILYGSSDEWTGDVDWLQEEIRGRDRTEQILVENESRDVLSWTESAGSLLLFSVKAYLREIGPGGVRQIVAKIREDAVLPSPQQMREFVGRALAGLG